MTRSTLYCAVSKGSHGETSPAKKGPAEKIPGVILNVVAVAQTQVSQCGDGKMRGREIKRLIGAAIGASTACTEGRLVSITIVEYRWCKGW